MARSRSLVSALCTVILCWYAEGVTIESWQELRFRFVGECPSGTFFISQNITLNEELRICPGNTVKFIGKENLGYQVTLTASTSRHVNIFPGASFSAENIAFVGGTGVSQTSGGYGGSIYSMGTLSLHSCSFFSNRARYGGAISVLKGTVNQVTNCMFEGNECTGSGCGGGAMLIYTDSIVGKIDQTTFKANIARGSAGGGAINLYKATLNEVTNCVFEGNECTGIDCYGGAMRIHSDSIVGKIEQTSFISNTAHSRGGAISGYKAQIGTITDLTLTNNKVTYSSGAGGALLLLSSSIMSIEASSFTGNKGNFGGAIYIKGSESKDLIIKNCHFTNNEGVNGGAIRLSETTMHSIAKTTFLKNKAVNGGAMEVYDSKITLIKNCAFASNEAKDLDTNDGIIPISSGGAIKNSGSIESIESCTFNANSAVHFGQDIYAAAEGVTLIRDTTFLSVETDEKSRVTGNVLTCDSPTNLTLCPLPNGNCMDTIRTSSRYGVKCGLSCEQGFYGIAPNECIGCSKGKFGAKIAVRQEDACELCDAGTFNPNTGQTKCETCPTGKYATMGALVCLRVCSRGQEQIALDACRDCDAGQFSDADPGAICTQCDDGYFSAAPGSAFCDRCPAGTFSNAEKTACEACPENTFSLGGNISCSPCNKKERSPPGSSRCVACEPGYEFLENSHECRPCLPGHERPHSNANCTKCSPGFVSAAEASPYCDQCKGGTYSNANQTACLQCPKGFYCPLGSSNATKCTDASTYCPPGSSRPGIVKAGHYSNDLRSTTKICELGHYCLNGVKAKCPENTYGNSTGLSTALCDGRCNKEAQNEESHPGSTECVCIKTFLYDNKTTSCVCPLGHYRDENAFQCKQCDAGTIQGKLGMQINACESCSFFMTSNDDQSKCVTDLLKLILFLLVASIVIGLAVFAVRSKFKKVTSRVQSVSKELLRQKTKNTELAKKHSKLMKENKAMKAQIALNKPTQKQESLFEKYRKILSGSDPEMMPHSIDIYSMDNNIVLEKSLGKGACGEVFKGILTEFVFGETIEKAAALKQLYIKSESLTQKMLDNFLAEVRNLSMVGHHQNIVAFYGVAWESESFPSIILEFVAGGDLYEYLEDYTCLPGTGTGLENESLIAIAVGITRGIQHIHENGMIHRDLKPQNVLLHFAEELKYPVAKIADFGESREADLSMTMTYVGTELYVAPEVFRGERYSQAADVFSLGMILNQLDTLQSPAKGVNVSAMNAKNPGSFRPLRRVNAPPHILSIIDACLEYNTEDGHGQDGDMSFGRPSIDSLLSQLMHISSNPSFHASRGRKISQTLRIRSSKPDSSKGHLETFLKKNPDLASRLCKAVPDDLLHTLSSEFEKYLETEVLPQGKYKSGGIYSTQSGKKSKSFRNSLKLATVASSLDEFLSLLRLSEYKQELLKLNRGTTLEDFENATLTADELTQSIPGMKRIHANRLCRFLKEHKENKGKSSPTMRYGRTSVRESVKSMPNMV